MGSHTRFLPLLVLAVAAGCTSPAADLTEDRPGTVAATGTTSPSSADGEAGVPGSAGSGADGQNGRSAPGGDADGNQAGTPRTSSGGPDRGSLAVTNNDVLIGAQFVDVQRVSFGSTSLGSTTTRTVRVGSLRPATISSVSLSSGAGVFRIVDDGCSGVRLSGSPCTVTVEAIPPDEGEHRGTLVFGYDTDEAEVELTVTGGESDQEKKRSTVESTQPELRPERTTDAPPTTAE
jgi:hypothetical protein